MNQVWIHWFKMYFAAMGIVCFAGFYLLACVWVGTDYSYTGGWFMFLTAFFMPIRFKDNVRILNVLHA